MPKKIENPLTEGLPSKVYLMAFSTPKSRYQIAREIYNIPKGQIPPTAKVSNVVRDLLTDTTYGKKYMIETENGVLSNVGPLADEIEIELKNHNMILTDREKIELTAFLHADFRETYNRFTKDKWQIKVQGDVNAYRGLRTFLGYVVFYVDLQSKFFQNKSIWNNMFREMQTEVICYDYLSPELIHKLKIFIPDELTLAYKMILYIEEKTTEATEANPLKDHA
jgi:hypothetical protein